MSRTVNRNDEEKRYEIRLDGELTGFVTFSERGEVIALTHTETFPQFAGQGLATTLIEETLDDVERRGLGLMPFCPFVNEYIAEHPERLHLVPEAMREKFGLPATEEAPS